MPWIVAKTKSRQEDIAASYIGLCDVETFVPKILEKTAPQPLFPRYVFVNIVSQWRFLLTTIGVLGVIKQGGGEGPAKLDQKVIDTIKLKQGRDGYVVLPKKPRFTIGQRVRIIAGCFEDRVALYHGSSSLEREMVLLNIMGRDTPISVGASSIVAAA